jgi:methanogenic corrinoid protein MtbC1
MSDMSHPIFSDLADPSRRDILLRLRTGPRSVTALVGSTGLKQPNVSNHLARLRERGIVRAQRIGRQVFYSLADPQIASLLSAALRAPQAQPKVATIPADVTRCRARLLQCLRSHDERAAGEVVSGCLSRQLPLERLYVEVFEPCLIEIGRDVDEGRASICDEHRSTAIVERLMACAMQFSAAEPLGARTAVVGCVEGNWHSIGPRMLADVLASRGWRCVYLGADVPTQSWVEAARTERAAAVLLSCGISDHREAAARAIAALQDMRRADPSADCAIGIGGAEIRRRPGLAERLGADFTARTVADLLPQLERALARAQTS